MSWIKHAEWKKREEKLQTEIYSILRDLIEVRRHRFKGISFSGVEREWLIDQRKADIVVFGPNVNDVFLIIETKRKFEEPNKVASVQVFDRACIGQAISYAALAKMRGYNVYFIATCNPDVIAIYKVPENVERIVNWDGIKKRKYEEVIPLEHYPDFLNQDKYAVFTLKLDLKVEFFQKLLDDLVSIWKRVKKPIAVQGFTLKVIEDIRSFVDWLSYNIEPIIRHEYNDLIQKYADQIKKIGYKPNPEHLTRQIAYVFMNKILFYKVLERSWNLPKLKPLYNKIVDGVKIDSASKYIEVLSRYFEKAVEETKKF